MLRTYVSVVSNFATRKCHNCCNMLQCWCRSMFLSLFVNVVYASVIVCNVAASYVIAPLL